MGAFEQVRRYSRSRKLSSSLHSSRLTCACVNRSRVIKLRLNVAPDAFGSTLAKRCANKPLNEAATIYISMGRIAARAWTSTVDRVKFNRRSD